MKTTLLLAFVVYFWIHFRTDLDGAMETTHQWGGVTDVEFIKIYQDDYFAFGAEAKFFQTIILSLLAEDAYSFDSRENILKPLDIFLPLTR